MLILDDYWTHNVAYHKWILKQVPYKSRVLEVGSGDGLLLKKMSLICSEVVGIDSHPPSCHAAVKRCKGIDNVTVINADFNDYDFNAGSFDMVLFVASIHHMDFQFCIDKAKKLLADGGKIIIVGCSAPKGFADTLIEAARIVPAKLGSIIHGEKNRGDIGVPVKHPVTSLKQINRLSAKLLPGAVIHRRLYYRYTLLWKKA